MEDEKNDKIYYLEKDIIKLNSEHESNITQAKRDASNEISKLKENQAEFEKTI